MAGDGKEGKGRATRLLTFGGLLIGVIVAGVGLLFQVAPRFAPCLGGGDAGFTGASVFPHENRFAYLIRNGISTEGEKQQLGVHVSFGIHASGFRGEELYPAYSVLTIEPDGTLGPVVADRDRDPGETIAPTDCSQSFSQDLFVPIDQHRKRYEIVLELFRDPKLTHRLAFTQTAIFRG